MGFISFIPRPAAVYPSETSAQHPSSCAASVWHLSPLLCPRAADSECAFCGAQAVQSIPAYQTRRNKPNKIILELGERFRSGNSSSSLLDLPSPEWAPLAASKVG